MRTKPKPERGPAPPLVIAHRGASGYLPEHTLAAKALAFAMGADYLEQDVVATRDRVPIVFHDPWLDSLTDVADVFPGRAREDGRHYCVDFDFAELQQLTVRERIDPATGEAVFPGRYPRSAPGFPIPALAEEIEFIAGLEKSYDCEVGIYPEIKDPGWHHENGIDLADLVLSCLDDFGHLEPDARAYLQCFDADELKRVRKRAGQNLRFIQLLDRDWRGTGPSLDDIAQYAAGVGPSTALVVGPNGQPTSFVRDAHAAGLEVHPWTFRADALPEGFRSFDGLLHAHIEIAGIDGLFTDFPDLVVAWLRERS